MVSLRCQKNSKHKFCWCNKNKKPMLNFEMEFGIVKRWGKNFWILLFIVEQHASSHPSNVNSRLADVDQGKLLTERVCARGKLWIILDTLPHCNASSTGYCPDVVSNIIIFDTLSHNIYINLYQGISTGVPRMSDLMVACQERCTCSESELSLMSQAICYGGFFRISCFGDTYMSHVTRLYLYRLEN